MIYLKTFENYTTDITEDIAEDLLPKLEEIRSEKGSITVSDFDEYMKQRGADSHTIDLVMSNLVSMGFDFDSEETEDGDDIEFELKDKFY
jgi:hypothetical protein